jgi:drug/metabolite transporter (DMT)-like permease
VTPAPLTTPLNSILLVMVGSFIGSIGMVFLKKASKDLHKGFFHIVNINSAIGVTLFVISSVFYLTGIRNGQLSVLYPMVSLSYVYAMFWARMVFKEPLTKQKFAGLGLVLVGVFFVGLGS